MPDLARVDERGPARRPPAYQQRLQQRGPAGHCDDAVGEFHPRRPQPARGLVGSWTMRGRRNARDYERLMSHAEAHVQWAFVTLNPRRLTRRNSRTEALPAPLAAAAGIKDLTRTTR